MNWRLNSNRFKSLDNSKIPNKSMMSHKSKRNQLRTKQWYSPRILKIHRWVRDRIISPSKKASKPAPNKRQLHDNVVHHLNKIRQWLVKKVSQTSDNRKNKFKMPANRKNNKLSPNKWKQMHKLNSKLLKRARWIRSRIFRTIRIRNNKNWRNQM